MQIIKVEPVVETFSISWNLGRRCNYDCMYCPFTLHDDFSPHYTLDQLKNYWENIYSKTKHLNLRYKISLSGGEATGNKNLIPFLNWLRNEYSLSIDKILLTTNGSATLKYYQRLFAVIDNISFSTHSEFFDEQQFFNKIIDLKKWLPSDRHMHVNIMDEWWNVDRIPAYQELLAKHNISNSVNKINYSEQTRLQPVMKGKLNLAISES